MSAYRPIPISYRQFDYWVSQGLIHVEGGVGSGHQRNISDDEAQVLKVMAALVGDGMSPRAAFAPISSTQNSR